MPDESRVWSGPGIGLSPGPPFAHLMFPNYIVEMRTHYSLYHIFPESPPNSPGALLTAHPGAA